MRFFHRDGHIYEIETAEPLARISLLSRFLANTIYNPSIRFSYRYRQLQKYDLAELKRAVQSALAHDDDVLTQFASKEELLSLLGRAESFDAVAYLIRKGTGSWCVA